MAANSFVSISTILEAVSAAFGVSIRDLRSSRQLRAFAGARQAACLLAYELTEQSFPQIGRSIGMRDHTTILYSVRTAQARCRDDADFAEKVQGARAAIRLIAHSELARLLRDPNALAVAHRICADPLRQATRVSTLETIALAVHLLSLDDVAGGAFVLLKKIAAAPAVSKVAELREQHAALIEAMTETLASIGYADPEAQPEEAKETLHV